MVNIHSFPKSARGRNKFAEINVQFANDAEIGSAVLIESGDQKRAYDCRDGVAFRRW